MTYIEGDVLQPISLILPVHEGTYKGLSGEIFLSGSKVWVNTDGTDMELVTSA